MSGILFSILIIGPFLWAYLTAGSDYYFGGFLFNPIDGNSYLAKMYQGWSGSWRFTLPYSHQSGDGAYLFLFYIALGHLARLTSQSLQTVFHLIRLIGSGILVFVIWNFYDRVCTTHRARLIAFVLAIFGSGLGWLASFFGVMSSDLWVAEAYPFLSAYANPHFPLGMSILVWVLTPGGIFGQVRISKNKIWVSAFLAIIGVTLAILLPFGIVIAAVMLTGLSIWDGWERVKKKEGTILHKQLLIVKALYSSNDFQKLMLLCIGATPVLVYQIWTTSTDPLLAIWNTQNLTITPPLWDLFVSFAPVLLFTIPGLWIVGRYMESNQRILVLWAIIGLFLLYVPWGLQRRFILGYMIPLAGLAGIGFDFIFSRQRRAALAMLILVFLMALPTNLLIVIGGVGAVQSREPMLFLSKDEKDSLMWLQKNSSQDAVILASPQMGLFIPAYTGRKVLYGHPFETVYAQEQESVVENFYSGNMNGDEISTLTNIDFIYFGPRERKLGEFLPVEQSGLVFQSGDVQILSAEAITRLQ